MATSTPLLFGGTFDPIHNGHLITARAAAEAIGANQVLLVPCAQSPHKQGVTSLTSSEHRLNLIKTVVERDASFGVLTLELERPAPSYTYDTVEKLLASGWREINWLIGADQLPRLPDWHRAADLVRRVTWIIVARPGFQLRLDALPSEFRNLSHKIVSAPLIEISSTDIRQRVRAGKSIRHLVPDSVEAYIRDHRLYAS